MADNPQPLSVTIQIQGNELAPTLKEIVDSMTDEDKQSLAANLAKEYFLKQMKPGKDSYGYQKTADDYMKRLCQQFEGAVQQTIKEDPELLKIITDTVDALRPDFPQFVKSAVIHVLGSMVRDGFNEVFDTQLQIRDLRARLESKLGSLGDQPT